MIRQEKMQGADRLGENIGSRAALTRLMQGRCGGKSRLGRSTENNILQEINTTETVLTGQ